MTLPLLRPLIAAILLTGSALAAGAQDFATYRNERHGFSLSYPAGTFAAAAPRPAPTAACSSPATAMRDCLPARCPMTDGMGLRDYRAFVLKQSYPDAAIDYAPVRDSWFVLSGTRDGMMFYERVTFTCGGRRINSWAMLYPATERQVYDRIVEQVARSYRPGAASCG